MLLSSSLLVPFITWNHGILQEFQNLFFWGFQRNQNYRHSYLWFSSPCTWSLCLEICSSSWPLSMTPTSTHPCTSSSPTCPLQISVYHHYHPQDAGEHPDTEQSHNLCRLHHPNVLFPILFGVGHLSFDRDGLWQVCGHLPSPALHGYHEPPTVWTPSSGDLDYKCLAFIVTKPNGGATVLLQRRGNPPLFLWTQSDGPTCLLWHLS